MSTDGNGTGTSQVLVVNAGSSSLKMKLLPAGESIVIERLGGPTSARASFVLVQSPRLERHDHAFDFGLRLMEEHLGTLDLSAVGHRVVHGGTRFVAPTVITEEVEQAIEELIPLAPLHNPGNLAAVRAARRALPTVPHVAVFDTAFHATLPPMAYHYGLPLEFALAEAQVDAAAVAQRALARKVGQNCPELLGGVLCSGAHGASHLHAGDAPARCRPGWR